MRIPQALSFDQNNVTLCFTGFGFLIGLVNGSPRSIRSTCLLDTDTG